MLTRTSSPSPTPLFESDGFDPGHVSDNGLKAFLAEFQRDGVGTIDLGPEARALCDRAIAETSKYFNRAGVRRVQDAWRRSSAVRDLATLPQILDALRIAYGREAFPFQTLSFQRGSEQEIHSDTIHFNSKPAGFMCGVWIALEDIAPEAGPLSYFPASHKLPVLTMRDAGVQRRATYADYPFFVDLLADKLAESNLPRREAVIPKGHAFFWAANVAHGGSPIVSAAATRHSLVVHYYFEDCLYYTPHMSDELEDKLFVRMPYDIKARRYRLSQRDGRIALPSAMSALPMLVRNLLRHPQAGP